MGFADELNSMAKSSIDRKNDEMAEISRSITRDVGSIKMRLADKVKEGTFNTPVGTRCVRCEWDLRGHFLVDVKRSFLGETRFYYMTPKDIDYCKRLQAALAKESIDSTLGFKRIYDEIRIIPADFNTRYKGYGSYPNNHIAAGDLIEWNFYLLCKIKF